MFNGSVRIDGDFKGNIFGSGTLVIGEGAEIEADIRVDSVMISGDVRGQIDVKKKIRIYSTGKVLGDLNTPVFSVEEGAFFEGTCHMTQQRSRGPYPPSGADGSRGKGMRRSDPPPSGRSRPRIGIPPATEL